MGVEWFDPMQVSGSDEFGGVPRLVDSLRRVWLEYDLGEDAGGILSRGLQRLRDDGYDTQGILFPPRFCFRFHFLDLYEPTTNSAIV